MHMQASLLELGRGPSHSISCIKQSTLRPRSFRKVKKSSRHAVRDACSPQLPHPEPPQYRASTPTPYTAYNPTIDIQIYRVNDDSPAANDSNTFHPRSPLGCWLAYFTLESGRMFTFQRTSAYFTLESGRMFTFQRTSAYFTLEAGRMFISEDLCRTPGAGSPNPRGSVEHRLRTTGLTHAIDQPRQQGMRSAATIY